MIPDICLPINFDVQIQDSLRIRETSFGENYTQVSEDGLNAELQTLTLRTLPLTDFQAEHFKQEMFGLKGQPFYWVNPRTKQRLAYRLSPNVLNRTYASNKWVQFTFRIELVPPVEA